MNKDPQKEMQLILLAYKHINEATDDDVSFGAYCDIDHYDKQLSILAWKLTTICEAAGITELAHNYDLSDFKDEVLNILLGKGGKDDKNT